MSLTKIFDINPNLRRSLVEAVSGETLDLTRSGTVWHFNPQNVLTEYAADTPAFGPKGLWSDGAGTQYFVNPDSPATQNIDLPTGDFCLWVVGGTSAVLAADTATIDSGGTATDGSPITFSVTGAGAVDVTINGSPTWCQLESGDYPTSYIYNDGTLGDGSTTSRATQAADGAGNGLAPALSDLDSRVEAALDSTFSTLFYLTPQFASTDIDATYHKLLSTGDFALSINNSNLAITDGTNTATVAHGGFDAGDELWLIGQADASTSKLRAGIIGDSSVTWGTETAYTGGMNPGTNLLVFEDNEEYAQIGGAWIYEGVAGSDGEMVEARDAVRDNNPRVAAVGVREVGVRPMMVNIM